MCGCMHTMNGMCVEVRRQFVGVGSLLLPYVGPGAQTQVIGLGSKYAY